MSHLFMIPGTNKYAINIEAKGTWNLKMKNNMMFLPVCYMTGEMDEGKQKNSFFL